MLIYEPSRCKSGLCLKNYLKNLLSKKVLRRVALSFKLSKIKSRVSFKFKKIWRFGWPKRIVFILLITFFLSGYYPSFSIPPVKHSQIFAQSSQQQEIIASSFPQPVILPHPGYLSTKFSHWHPGIDIATTLGTPVHPITQGTVEETIVSFWGYGNHVIVSHTNGFKSLYGHLGRVFAKKGQEVTTQISIGEVGISGFSSGPHTHLEITHNGKYIDPLLILPTIESPPPKQ